MTDYPFLLLCLLLILPVLIVGVCRHDLVPHMSRMALISLPFAFTEFMFYPDYWSPPFLFDAAARFGFGLEDFAFVAALGAMAVGVYPAIAKKQLKYRTASHAVKATFLRVTTCGGMALLLAVVGWMTGIPALYAALGIMFAITVVLLCYRTDLLGHACKNGLVSLVVYGAVCLTLEGILPGTFACYWHTDTLLNTFAGPVPIEELAYGVAAGFSATVIYPFAFDLEFIDYPVCKQAQ